MNIWRGGSPHAEGVNWLNFEAKRDVFARKTIPGKNNVHKNYSIYAIYVG